MFNQPITLGDCWAHGASPHNHSTPKDGLILSMKMTWKGGEHGGLAVQGTSGQSQERSRRTLLLNCLSHYGQVSRAHGLDQLWGRFCLGCRKMWAFPESVGSKKFSKWCWNSLCPPNVYSRYCWDPYVAASDCTQWILPKDTVLGVQWVGAPFSNKPVGRTWAQRKWISFQQVKRWGKALKGRHREHHSEDRNGSIHPWARPVLPGTQCPQQVVRDHETLKYPFVTTKLLHKGATDHLHNIPEFPLSLRAQPRERKPQNKGTLSRFPCSSPLTSSATHLWLSPSSPCDPSLLPLPMCCWHDWGSFYLCRCLLIRKPTCWYFPSHIHSFQFNVHCVPRIWGPLTIGFSNQTSLSFFPYWFGPVSAPWPPYYNLRSPPPPLFLFIVNNPEASIGKHNLHTQSWKVCSLF